MLRKIHYLHLCLLLYPVYWGCNNAENEIKQPVIAGSVKLHTLSYYNEVLSKQPDDTLALFARSELFYRAGDTLNALNDLQDVLKINPESRKAMVLCGKYEYEKHCFLTALNYFNQALTVFETDTLALFYRAHIFLYMKNCSHAINDLMRLRKYSRSNGLNYLVLADAYAECGKSNMGFRFIDQVLKQNPGNPVALHARANLHVKNKHFDLAVNDYLASLQQMDKGELLQLQAAAYNNLGYCYLQMKLPGKAFSNIKFSLLLFVKNPYAHKNMALYYLYQQQPDSAKFHLQQAISMDFRRLYGREADSLLMTLNQK